ncbi:fatty acid/sphingolipid desaturase [Stereum hirsutum FP-91666 SS1]|uniref:fatty acid/sphingolipid desaturase n=1 Tax=Stereum hirsutum (strain FP-91666) TaxID=721885 RepID=UPI000440C32D|nr:fatty acid/sphingolipid desaturase [Stereum hirsutum FP-91666 SS1]EIM92093.1 fatty acid/sphingolipid desaturase [Stereum hirsutum FP-91666 SS1]
MGVPTTVLPCWTREQVAARIIAGDNIFILHDKLIRVPNSWLSAHPGGSLSIHHFTGRDATDEVEAFHSDPTLKRMLGYAIGTVSLGEEGWVPLLPPAHAGWIRKIGDDGQLHWHKESTELYSDEPSEESPSSQILLLAKADNPSTCPSALTLEPAPTTLSLKQQSQHSAAYKQLHKRIADAGLYNCRYITGYGPEIVRYVIMAIGAYVFYQKQWFLTSAFCLGALWHQLVFTVHDLGHLGVTHDWTTDRAIAIFIANWMGGLSVGWWVANHNVHHVVTNHPSHDPDIQHLPFFAISPAFFNSLWSTYYKRELTFDLPARYLIAVQHRLFYIIMSLARFNLYRLSYEHLWKTRNDPRKAKGGRWYWWGEIIGLVVWAFWYGRVLLGCGTWGKTLGYLMISNMVPSPLHVQIVLSHFSRSTADLGPTESFVHRQLRTTTDVICHPSLAFLHGGLHLQVTHHLFPRLPRHNLLDASYLVKEFCKEQGLEYAEFGFWEGNGEVRGTLKSVADQLKIVKMVADREIEHAMGRKRD